MVRKKKNANNGKQVEKKQHSAKSFLSFIFLPVTIMLVVSLLFGFGYHLLIATKKDYNTMLLQVESQAQLLAQQVNHAEGTLKHTISNAASLDTLATALTHRDPEQIAQLEASVNTLIPYSLKTRIIAKGTVKPDRKAFPPLSFSTVDMVQKTEMGEAIPPEVSTAEGKLILNCAYPIKSGDEIIGVFLTSIDFRALLGQTGASINEHSSLQLVQQFKNGTPLVLLSQGKKQLQESIVRSEQNTNNPNWKLIYAASPINPIDGLLEFFTPVLVAFLLGATATLVAFKVTEKHLRLDSVLLISHLEELKFGQYSRRPDFKVLFMETLDYTLERILTDYKNETEALPNQYAKSRATASTKDASKSNHGLTLAQEAAAELDLPEGLTTESPSLQKEFPGHGLPSAEVDDKLELPDIPASIFRAYDIRGIVDADITEDTIRLLGKSIGSEALEKGEQSLFVGRDGRLSSPALSEALVEGLLSTGIHVINIGLVPTPVLWFACHTEESSRSGVMVTGSHNPKQYNGLKIMIAGDTLSGEGVLALRNRLIRNAIEQGSGEESKAEFKEKYINHIAEDVILATPMTIVLDSGNGAAGEIAPELFEELGCNTISLFSEIDGNFPNHHPDPSREENLEALKNAVKENNADLGIAFDGDGDRIGIVTPSGKVIWPDRLMMLYAKDLLVRNPGADIIFDVKCSRRLPELITNLGGRPLMWKTGHSMIKGKLKEMNAALAGEMSGHIFFNDRWFGFDDALYCGARLLEILSTESEGVEQVFADLPENLATPEILIPVPEDRKFQIIKSLEEKGQFGSGKVNTIDGVRVDFPKAWGLVRASNTTPALTARFEAHNEEALEQIKGLFQKQLQMVDENLIIYMDG